MCIKSFQYGSRLCPKMLKRHLDPLQGTLGWFPRVTKGIPTQYKNPLSQICSACQVLSKMVCLFLESTNNPGEDAFLVNGPIEG